MTECKFTEELKVWQAEESHKSHTISIGNKKISFGAYFFTYLARDASVGAVRQLFILYTKVFISVVAW